MLYSKDLFRDSITIHISILELETLMALTLEDLDISSIEKTAYTRTNVPIYLINKINHLDNLFYKLLAVYNKEMNIIF